MSEIKTVEGTFDGKYNTKIFWRKWLPEVENKATLIIVHGLNEHSGRYYRIAEKLVPNNIAVYTMDHRGHGKSEGKRAYVKKFEDLIDDLRTYFLDYVQKESENKPIFILGHSMGSVITMNYVRMYPDRIKAMILSGTGAKNTTSPLLKLGAKILSVIAPKGSINLPFPEGWITRDQSECDKYDDDPLCLYKTCFRLGAEINKWLKIGAEGVKEISVPVLIQCGEKDISFEGREELFERFGSKDKTLKIYPDCRHEVYNELPEDRKIIIDDLAKWIESHI